MPPPAVQIANVHKHFAGAHAVRGADLQAAAGECHALIGANGAGKSTLAKILGGSLVADAGEVRLSGRRVSIRTPHDGMAAGVGMVPQEPLLANNLTVAENIMLGRERTRGGRLDCRADNEQSARLLSQVGLDIDPETPMDDLDIAAQQLVQVARALGCDTRVLILDEPTSAITAHECETLFRLIDNLREVGVTIIYVSHRLPEVFRLAERVTVMRDGRSVRTFDTASGRS